MNPIDELRVKHTLNRILGRKGDFVIRKRPLPVRYVGDGAIAAEWRK